jgi:DNA-binding PadR family transcriptional regulator
MRHSKHFQCHIRNANREDGMGGGYGGKSLARGIHSPRGGRVFGHGGIRFVLLQLINDKPSHGYELIKLIEEKLAGSYSYSPSPGTVYPTLTLMEEQGLLHVEEADMGGRKRYCITDAGRIYLEEHRATVDAMLARMQGGVDGVGPSGARPPQVMRAIENLKLAMRMRLSREALTPEQANAFAALLDHTAQQLEQI